MNKRSNQSLLTRISICLFLVIIGIWVPFIHLYLLNSGNLTLPLSVHVPLLGLLSAAVVGVGLALQTLLPVKHRNRASLILLLTGIFLWAEGTLFIGDFGFLTGGFLDWGKNRYILFLELLLAGVLGFIIYRFKGALLRHAVLVSCVLIFSASANVFPALQMKKSPTSGTEEYTFTQEGVFQVSPEKNVLVFIIDTFQSDVFAELLAENVTLKNTLSGFTYFPDATSAFPKTYTSVPNLLTGRAFDNSKPYALFQKDAYVGDSAPKILKENGFDVRYKTFTWQPFLAHPAVADNLTNILSADGRLWMQQDEFLQLFNLAIFRLTPFLLKPWVYHENEWRLTPSIFPKRINTEPYQLADHDRKYSKGNKNWDMAMLDQMLAFLTADSDKPTFRVFHFLGVHEPMVIDRDLNFIPRQEHTRTAFKDQSEGMLKLLDLIFSRLREMGAYDNSLIFVVGDHGASNLELVGVKDNGALELGWDIDLSETDFGFERTLVQGGIPLLMAKPIAEKGSLVTSFNAVELGDIPQTIFSELGLQASVGGISLFETPDAPDRIRYHRHYRFAGWGQDYLLPMTEYQIKGFSWDPASWSRTTRNLNQLATDTFEGNLIVLGDGGNFDQYTHQGWGIPLKEGRTISEPSASIMIPWAQVVDSNYLEIRMRKKFSSKDPIPMTVSIDDFQLEDWKIFKATPNIIRVAIPEQVSSEKSELEIKFELKQNPDRNPIFMEIRLLNSTH